MPPSTTPAYELLAFQGTDQPALRQKCFDIRAAVFHVEQGFPLDTEFDDLEDSATHILLRLTPALTPAGTIRGCRAADGSYYKLTRLAVVAGHRKHGFGRVLTQRLHEWARADAAAAGKTEAAVVAHAQMHAIPFYERLGYVAEGDVFEEEGAPHQRVVLRIFI